MFNFIVVFTGVAITGINSSWGKNAPESVKAFVSQYGLL